MHDSVELFLHLASEHLNAGTKIDKFMDYWEPLNNKLKPMELEQRESMRRLNNARGNLKHKGIYPPNLNIEEFRLSTKNFFEANTPIVFGRDLEEISLIEFVNPESSRELLREAQSEIENNEINSALGNIALSSVKMISDYEDRKKSFYGRSPFYFGKALTFQGRTYFEEGVVESIVALQDAIKILALGMDYRKYSKFQQLTPPVNRPAGMDWRVYPRFPGSHETTEEDARFCVDFVIESSLALAEFDYSVEHGQ